MQRQATGHGYLSPRQFSVPKDITLPQSHMFRPPTDRIHIDSFEEKEKAQKARE